jgi:hypothetical protein
MHVCLLARFGLGGFFSFGISDENSELERLDIVTVVGEPKLRVARIA